MGYGVFPGWRSVSQLVLVSHLAVAVHQAEPPAPRAQSLRGWWLGRDHSRQRGMGSKDRGVCDVQVPSWCVCLCGSIHTAAIAHLASLPLHRTLAPNHPGRRLTGTYSNRLGWNKHRLTMGKNKSTRSERQRASQNTMDRE